MFAIVLASTAARYLKRGKLSVFYFRGPVVEVPHLQPMAAIEYRMRGVWCEKKVPI